MQELSYTTSSYLPILQETSTNSFLVLVGSAQGDPSKSGTYMSSCLNTCALFLSKNQQEAFLKHYCLTAVI